MSVEIDDQRFPLVLVRYTRSHSDASWQAYLETMSRFVSRGVPYVTLTDARAVPAPSARQRRMASDVIAREEARTKRFVVANAVVVDSALLRGALTAVHWVAPPPVPLDSFATPQLAYAWLMTMYAERTGEELPPLPPAFFRG